MAKAYHGPVEINGIKFQTRGDIMQQRLVEWPEVAPQGDVQSRTTRRLLQSWEVRDVAGLQVD